VLSSTPLEARLDERARRFLASAPASRIRPKLTEFVVFGLKQAWACIFGAALLAVLMAARLWYPDGAGLARNDFLTLAAVVIVFGRCVMHFRVFRKHHRMPLLVAFLLVALFIWVAENMATWSGAWLYPGQVDGWEPVGLEKLVAWFLLMIISVVLVAWVYKPQPPGVETPDGSATAKHPNPAVTSKLAE
jgi:uncharacterized membrane protein YoaT (DUF817 family)